jgi:hypothetical protein
MFFWNVNFFVGGGSSAYEKYFRASSTEEKLGNIALDPEQLFSNS